MSPFIRDALRALRRTFVGDALRALRRTFAGQDYPPQRPLRSRRRLAVVGPAAGMLAIVGLAAITVDYLQGDRGLPAATAWLIALITVAPLAFLFSRPLVAWRLLFAGELLGTFNREQDDVWPWSPTQIAVIVVVLLVVAAQVDRAVLAWIGLFSVIPVWIFVKPGNQVGVTLLFVGLLVLGNLVRRNRLARRALAEQSELSELEKARRAVLEERTRIAREMHDVVAHHMSMIAVQAETAPYRLGTLPEPAREEFTAIAGAARTAMVDMRRLLGVLRSETAPLKVPQPGLSDLPELVAATARAGVDTRLDVADGPPPPEAVGLAAYRIVQEALANASRHAPGATVRVEARPSADELRVAVHNGPSAEPPPDPLIEGHGLAGMRERAQLLGGELTAGPTGDGGFAVAARLPYHERTP